VPNLTIDIPPLHSGQREVLRLLDTHRFVVVSAGRRFGKTLLSCLWLAMMPGGAIQGRPVAFFAPTYKLLSEVWADVERTLRPIIKKSNKTEGRIELITKGVIDFWTLEDKDAGRGRKYHRVVLDECAHARYLRDAWERAISPTLTDFKGRALFISTPNGLNEFHALFQRGWDEQATDWASFHAPSTSNPHIDPAEIERARTDLPELVYAQEYLAEFVTFGAGLIKPDYLRDGIAPDGLPVVLGVDLAISEKEGADWTAIAALSRDPQTGRVYVREIERFRAGFHDVIGRIKAAAARWSPVAIAIEQVQYQAAVVQELHRTTRLPVKGIRPDKDKVTRFLPLLTRYEQRMVDHDPSGVPAWFREELLSFPEGAHEDGVDALSLCWAALKYTDLRTRTMAVPSL